MTVPAHWFSFEDFPGNPIIEPPGPEWMIADPTVLPPDDSPDGKWHLFANSLRGIHHYTSENGYEWRRLGGPLFPGLRPCIRREKDTFYLFYELYVRFPVSHMVARSSPDLRRWSEPAHLLKPSLPWEGKIPAANGNPSFVSGPFGFRLYYSASAIWLPDCLFIEPRHIGVAEAESILGPYRKRPEPILSPDPKEPFRNFGAGAIKVFLENGKFIGLNNGIYKDAEGRSRSAILVLESSDGFSWKKAREKPIIQPEGDGWKKALVYALDLVRHGKELRLYYNARSGWFVGSERIGVAVGRAS
ncbi:MAG: glycosyl hydrolase family 43 [Bdellovibrionota bacterium]